MGTAQHVTRAQHSQHLSTSTFCNIPDLESAPRFRMAGQLRPPSRLFKSSVARGGLVQVQDLKTASTGRHCRSYDYPEFDEVSEEAFNRRKKRGISVESSEPMLSEPANSLRVALPSFVGHETAGTTIFGMLFPKRSFPLDASNCTQVNTQSWVLDMNIFVGEAYDQVEEICIYLLSESSLPPEKAVAVYVQSPGSQFQYRGAVYQGCPSAVLPLLWPKPGAAPESQQSTSLTMPTTTRAQIGISVENLSSLPVINMGVQRLIEGLALRIWENLFNLMSSCTIDGERLLVPKRLVDQRFQQFKDRSRKDPEYLKSFLAPS